MIIQFSNIPSLWVVWGIPSDIYIDLSSNEGIAGVSILSTWPSGPRDIVDQPGADVGKSRQSIMEDIYIVWYIFT